MDRDPKTARFPVPPKPNQSSRTGPFYKLLSKPLEGPSKSKCVSRIHFPKGPLKRMDRRLEKGRVGSLKRRNPSEPRIGHTARLRGPSRILFRGKANRRPSGRPCRGPLPGRLESRKRAGKEDPQEASKPPLRTAPRPSRRGRLERAAKRPVERPSRGPSSRIFSKPPPSRLEGPLEGRLQDRLKVVLRPSRYGRLDPHKRPPRRQSYRTV